MRLQSAIFTLGDTLFTPDGAAREGLDKALSLFKMEGVWLGAVTALSAEDAQKALEKAGLNSYFRFVLTESVALCKAVAVQGSAGAADWSTMQQLATQSLENYSELLAQTNE